jgi:hypothetical protein
MLSHLVISWISESAESVDPWVVVFLWLMMVNDGFVAIHMGYQWLMMVNGDING